MSIAQNFPALKPALNLDFANVKKLDPRISFSRASVGTYFDANGVLQTASANVARFDHDPVTGESLGLLVEESRTNLALRSEELDTATWVKSQVTSSKNVIVAPSGTLTGNIVVPDTTSNLHSTRQDFSGLASLGTYTFSAYVKAGGYSRVGLAFGAPNFSDYSGVLFDLTDGSILGESSVGTATRSVSIQDVGNGWYRISLTVGNISSTNYRADFRIVSSGTSIFETFTGDGYSGIYIWGAQLESGQFSTSYVKTEASQVTRSADSASMTGTNFSEWYRQDEGTLYAEAASRSSSSANAVIAQVDSGNANEIISILHQTDNQAVFRIRINNAEVFVAGFGFLTNGIKSKTVGSFKSGANNAFLNGVTSVSSTTTYSIPATISVLNIGQNQSGGQKLNGCIAKLAYYSKASTATQLQAITG